MFSCVLLLPSLQVYLPHLCLVKVLAGSLCCQWLAAVCGLCVVVAVHFLSLGKLSDISQVDQLLGMEQVSYCDR